MLQFVQTLLTPLHEFYEKMFNIEKFNTFKDEFS